MADYSKLAQGINLKVQMLTAEYNTLEAKNKTIVDQVDNGIVHETTGAYVIKSTDGYFPNRTGAAYRFCALIGELLVLQKSRSKQNLLKVDKMFNEAVWEGFINPTNPGARKKKSNFRDLRKDASIEDFNDLLADIYDEGTAAFQQAKGKKDEVNVQIFGSIFAAAAIASDTDAPPFNFDFATQNSYVENIKNSIEVLKKNL
uniref:Uncharacterized protein n=1 Tax=Aplanochytrium stocchinoi TaxID=215587 RepID=A0A7S3V0G8_9STRA|mmetsp:Transcript_16636/g.21276  ORF Transcript_16636/g.21276 Transcript_16636/m.21276 type:complete len:202 (+) Transcript_16636:65-670(+)|eukprot:CAMPEP_0204832788 /NCGR_PEP_ID=MMETSP1346-20131115/14772_1 /ASSEMBLY_ACC=CAM_ASM_000771 /TAXON_ID=215587 /ORGANISM="Aplanochytrium stocchinoi, Strain GSBS06" /LENGTH=201 /DNA_ID=CAMNT_0051964831 /DNA_START=59 /DNA_END=664 /DNA_ORIENTATION=-